MSVEKMMSGAKKANAMSAAFAETAPNPSQKELQRQALIINEVLKRLDTLSAAIIQQKPPLVHNSLPEMCVTVEAAEVNVPAPVVNVAQPNITVEAPNVTVEAARLDIPAAIINVPVPSVHVSAPNVDVAAPTVNVAGSEVTVTPSVTVHQPRRWRFTHSYEGNSLRPHETIAEAID